MNTSGKPVLTAEVIIDACIEKVWKFWTSPAYIMQWNAPNPEWHTSFAENDLRPGGRFLFAMALKDGTLSFDFTGRYDSVSTNRLISYTLDDGRRSTVTFTGDEVVSLTESFEPGNSPSYEMQQQFCQAVLDNFKRYAESNK